MLLTKQCQYKILYAQELVRNSEQQLVNLANQWEKHQAALLQQIAELKEASQGHVVYYDSIFHIPACDSILC